MESTIQLFGAGAFGIIIGWYLYFINRYRKEEVTLGDITTVIGAIGGAAVTALFDREGNLFGAYGIGLFIGFFSYLLVLAGLVTASDNFDKDWFLDGRRKMAEPPFHIPGDVHTTAAAMKGEDKKGGFGQ